MYVIDADTKIKNLTSFVDTNYVSLEEFVLMSCKSFIGIPIDCFGIVTYNHSHLMYGRVRFLEDKGKHDLVKFGLLWDIAKLFSSYSLIKVKQEEAFEELVELFELTAPTQAEMTSILAYDATAPDYSETCFEYMKNAVAKLGYYSVSFTGVYNLIKGYLFK
jgi:hypothetical protein